MYVFIKPLLWEAEDKSQEGAIDTDMGPDLIKRDQITAWHSYLPPLSTLPPPVRPIGHAHCRHHQARLFLAPRGAIGPTPAGGILIELILIRCVFSTKSPLTLAYCCQQTKAQVYNGGIYQEQALRRVMKPDQEIRRCHSLTNRTKKQLYLQYIRLISAFSHSDHPNQYSNQYSVIPRDIQAIVVVESIRNLLLKFEAFVSVSAIAIRLLLTGEEAASDKAEMLVLISRILSYQRNDRHVNDFPESAIRVYAMHIH
ncbi:hypothetical protein HUJ04_000540 [Dendroctonus ponderosae]|nr:hypothetical protein HUJ04_000540 [Dendroctonus ponderosae]